MTKKIEVFEFMQYFFNVYLFLREIQSMGGAEAERGGSRFQSRFQAVSIEPDMGLELTVRS